jgi:hypothetical protein
MVDTQRKQKPADPNAGTYEEPWTYQLMTLVGAALLVCVMCGAVLTHLLLIGGSPVPALVLGCLAAFILWGRRGALKAWLARRPG